MKWTGNKVGLALGGGGVRGFTHIGVLKVLEQEAIDIDLIVGTSVGALIGGAYASGLSPREIQVKVADYLISPEFNAPTLKSIGMSVSPKQQEVLQKIHASLPLPRRMVRSVGRFLKRGWTGK